jgi:dihydroxyacetone kinase-like predicted kinase
MNPSTDDILHAIEQTPASTVFVLPNNKNIIMAAEQAIPLSTRKVIVLPTRTIPQGISAMLSYDPDSDDDTNTINMQKGYANVQTGQVYHLFAVHAHDEIADLQEIHLCGRRLCQSNNGAQQHGHSQQQGQNSQHPFAHKKSPFRFICYTV